MADNVTTQDTVVTQTPVVASVAASSVQTNEPAALNLRDAFDKTLQISQTIAVSDLLPVNVDLPTAVTTAVGSLPRILALRGQVKEELPKFDMTHFEQLEQYALAAAHAHGNFLAASAPPEALLELNDRGTALRDMLYTDATALAKRGLISGDKLGDFKTNVGYKNITYDLVGLASLLRGNWASISTRTGILPSDLDEAESLAGKLISALSAREQAPSLVADVSVQRQRNFTLFAKAYDQVRRALSYLRWDAEDLEKVAPSLYGGRISRKKDDTQPSTAPTTQLPAATGSAPAAGTTPATVPVTGATSPGTAAHTTAAASALPGANPFATAAS